MFVWTNSNWFQVVIVGFHSRKVIFLSLDGTPIGDQLSVYFRPELAGHGQAFEHVDLRKFYLSFLGIRIEEFPKCFFLVKYCIVT